MKSQLFYPKTLVKLLDSGELLAMLEPVVHFGVRDGDFPREAEMWRALRLPNGRALERVDLWVLSERGTSEGLEGITQLRNVCANASAAEVEGLWKRLLAVLPALAVVELAGLSGALVPTLGVFPSRVHVIADLGHGEKVPDGVVLPPNVEAHRFMQREPDRKWLDALLQ